MGSTNKLSKGSKTFEDAGRFLMVELLLWPQVDVGVKNPWFTVDWFTEKILPLVHKAVKKRNPRKQKMVSSLNCLRVLNNGGAIENTPSARIITRELMEEESILLSTDQQMKISDGNKIRVNSLRRLTVGMAPDADFWVNSSKTNRFDKYIQKSWNDLIELLKEDMKIAKGKGMTAQEFYEWKEWI